MGVGARIMIPSPFVSLMSAAAGSTFSGTVSASNIVPVIGESLETRLNEGGGRLSRGYLQESHHVISFTSSSSSFFYLKFVVAAKYSGRATYE